MRNPEVLWCFPFHFPHERPGTAVSSHLWCHGPPWLLHSCCHPAATCPHQDVTCRRMCSLRQCPSPCTHSRSLGCSPCSAPCQVCYVKKRVKVQPRTLNMKSEFVCLLRSLAGAEWSCINKNSGWQMLGSCRNTCTNEPSQDSADTERRNARWVLTLCGSRKQLCALFKFLLFLFLISISFMSFLVLHL